MSLYDEAGSLKGPMKAGASTDWDTASSEIGAKLAELAAAGKQIALLSSTVISPSTQKAIAKFSEAFPTAKWVQYDAISYHGALEANAESFGKRAFPDYHFDKADLIVGVGADFIGTWL